MKLLAFDTSTSTCLAAICRDHDIIQCQQTVPKQHGKLLLPMLRQLLSNLALDLDDLDAIAYGFGPGSFTGVRLASSVAQAFAFAKNKPVLQLSSLHLLAETAWLTQGAERVIVIRDAKMGQVYLGCYDVINDHMQAIFPDKTVNLAEINTQLAHYFEQTSLPYQGVGDGWNLVPSHLRPRLLHSTLMVNGEALIRLAKMAFQSGKLLTAPEAQPNYLS